MELSFGFQWLCYICDRTLNIYAHFCAQITHPTFLRLHLPLPIIYQRKRQFLLPFLTRTLLVFIRCPPRVLNSQICSAVHHFSSLLAQIWTNASRFGSTFSSSQPSVRYGRSRPLLPLLLLLRSLGQRERVLRSPKIWSSCVVSTVDMGQEQARVSRGATGTKARKFSSTTSDWSS